MIMYIGNLYNALHEFRTHCRSSDTMSLEKYLNTLQKLNIMSLKKIVKHIVNVQICLTIETLKNN